MARQILKSAYETCGGNHPSTAEVMNTYDKLVNQQVMVDGTGFFQHSAEVMKVLLAVARRNTDGRWLSSLYKYKKELENSEDSFCSQKTHKKEIRNKERTEIHITLSDEEHGKEGRAHSLKTKKGSLLERHASSNSLKNKDEFGIENNQDSLEKDRLSQTSNEGDFSFEPDCEEPQTKPPKPLDKPHNLQLRFATQSDLPSEIFPRLNTNTSKNRSDIRANLKLMSKSSDRARVSETPVKHLQKASLRTASFGDFEFKNGAEEAPSIQVSAYTFYRIRLLTKAMYSLQTAASFAKRLKQYLEARISKDKVNSMHFIFAVLKSNWNDIREEQAKEEKAKNHQRTASLKDSIIRWRFGVQLIRRDKIFTKAIETRNRKRLLARYLGYMKLAYDSRIEEARLAEHLGVVIARNRLCEASKRYLILIHQARESKNYEKLRIHLLRKSFHLLNAAVTLAKEINKPDQLTENLAMAQLKSTLLIKSFKGLLNLIQEKNYNLENANLIYAHNLLKNSFKGWNKYNARKRAQVPIYSDRQAYLGFKYLGFMKGDQEGELQSISSSKSSRFEYSRRDAENLQAVRWSQTSRVEEEDFLARLSKTSGRYLDNLTSNLPCQTARVFRNSLALAVGSSRFYLLQLALGQWKSIVIARANFKHRIRINKLRETFLKFSEGIEKSVKLRSAERRIILTKDSSLKEIMFIRWKEIFQESVDFVKNMEKAKKFQKKWLLKRTFFQWKIDFVKELATERKVRHFSSISRHRVLLKVFESLKIDKRIAESKRRFDSFINSHYIRCLMVKSFIGLKNYRLYRNEKATMKKVFTPLVQQASKRRWLNRLKTVLYNRCRLRNLAASIEGFLKRKSITTLKENWKLQEAKVSYMRQRGLKIVLLKSSLLAWRNYIVGKNERLNQALELQKYHEMRRAKNYLLLWASQARAVIEANNQEQSAAAWYDIKILVRRFD